MSSEADDLTLSLSSCLRDIEAWISFRLESAIKHQASVANADGSHSDGYSYVEVPEWEARQKLDNVRTALGNYKDITRCAHCGSSDIEDISGEYETGVIAPDGYRERRYENAFHCTRCGQDQEYED